MLPSFIIPNFVSPFLFRRFRCLVFFVFSYFFSTFWYFIFRCPSPSSFHLFICIPFINSLRFCSRFLLFSFKWPPKTFRYLTDIRALHGVGRPVRPRRWRWQLRTPRRLVRPGQRHGRLRDYGIRIVGCVYARHGQRHRLQQRANTFN